VSLRRCNIDGLPSLAGLGWRRLSRGPSALPPLLLAAGVRNGQGLGYRRVALRRKFNTGPADSLRRLKRAAEERYALTRA